MTTTVQKQVLINARALIADPQHWARGVLAQTADGRPIAWYQSSADRWCAVGAINRAAYDLLGDLNKARRIGKEVASIVYPHRWFGWALPDINDAQGHTAVLALFDKALELA
jgi:hypothetical protein